MSRSCPLVLIVLIAACATEGSYVEGPAFLGEFALPTRSAADVSVNHGRLSAKDGVRTNGSYADRYTVWAEAGTRLSVELESNAIDCYLLLFDGAGAILAEDDDSGEGYDARLTIEIPRSETYVLLASSYSQEEGPYELRVLRSGGSYDYERLAVPATLIAAFDDRDLYSESRATWFRVWALDLQAGAPVAIEMQSTDLDSLLILYDEAGTQLAQDDDSGGGYDARLVYRPVRSGRFFLLATTYGYGRSETGEFVLTVQ